MDSDETFFFEPVDGWKDKTFIVICSPDDPIPEIVQMKKDIRRMDKHIKELDDRIYSAIIDSKNRKYQVFDYDRFMRDDFMGTANISLSTLNLSQ
uniref:Transcriptional regulator n=1 Tax=Meloidogyne hapla TaxID=6305 RepID=A0A1I8BSC9_MELHA